MNKIYKLSFLLIIALSSFVMNAQVEVEKSDNLIFVLGKKYYLHKVESGQTLYSICRVYGVNEADIFSENSVVAREGLKAGSEIKIPVKDPNEITTTSSSNSLNTSSSSTDYINHTVKKKQTLYFLTHTYNVSEAELIKLNPEISQGLKVGQVIKVPKPGTVKVTSSGDFRLHTVQPGETLFSLAQRYGVEISSLKLNNPELNSGGLKVGKVLRIPTRTRSFEELLKVEHNKIPSNEYYDYDPLYFEEPGVTPCNAHSYNGSSFKIAVLLPLYVQENATMKNSGRYYKNTERFYEFYQGLLLAAKKMKSLGVSVEFIVKDTKASNQRVKEILSLSTMRNVDLIIGPVYSANFRLASAFAKEHKINIVAPFKLKHESLVVTNPYAFLANPSEETEVGEISSFLSSSYDNSILVVHNGSVEEDELIETYKKKLVQAFVPYEQINEIVFKQVNFKLGGAAAVENALSVGLHNIVIIPSNDQVFITKVITKLNYLSKNYKITLYGRSAWENFRNIEIDYLRNLKFHYGTTGFVDKKDKSVKNFDYSYKTYFKAVPSTYSYMGYDISYFFLNVLKDYGRHFQFCLPSAVNKNYTKGLCYEFNFKRVSPFSGFENNWLGIVKINKTLELVKVN
jgi:LysM repeat protein